MPKMKTKSGVAKRFKKTGTGKIKRNHAFTNHMFKAKSPKQKRNLRKSAIMHSGDVKRIKQLIAYK
ncbi:50S ribosomal protein L35 [Hazenella sp. IB182357]|uniref:Large ribosomal subunit protein bL35 n=1 Tax=Polycladospora coralii TaxID=2771432 RepID=A0A926RUC8_9BACL|nr:50S ribosomal protein L35 [Polycladospora coralii]MBD1372808.1 50S ribosomal protein L35 [Polycladospora coralii]MBS7529494.1 50S ribosomal protein L35 [Polycladospora coralii]